MDCLARCRLILASLDNACRLNVENGRSMWSKGGAGAAVGFDMFGKKRLAAARRALRAPRITALDSATKDRSSNCERFSGQSSIVNESAWLPRYS